MELAHLTLFEIQQKIKAKEISCQEITAAQLKRIEKLNAQLNAFITLCPEKAMARAQELDQNLAKNPASDLPPLFGVPMGLKDIFLTEGVRTTCASKILGDYIPPYNSTAYQKLLEAQVVRTPSVKKISFNPIGTPNSGGKSLVGFLAKC